MKQLDEVIKRFINDAVAKIHTATIGRVVKVSAKTIDVQPVINLIYNGRDLPLPVLAEVPPVFMQGGGSYTAHPIAIGDYALVVFTERAFDRWYDGVDGVRPPELRMHDYSDGFAIVGVNPLAAALDIPQVIQQTGDTNYDGNHTHQGDNEQTGNYTLTGNQEVNGNVTINGNLTVNGDITCTGTLTVPTIMTANVTASGGVSIAGVDFGTHTHPYTWTDPAGSGNTGEPQ